MKHSLPWQNADRSCGQHLPRTRISERNPLLFLTICQLGKLFQQPQKAAYFCLSISYRAPEGPKSPKMSPAQAKLAFGFALPFQSEGLVLLGRPPIRHRNVPHPMSAPRRHAPNKRKGACLSTRLSVCVVALPNPCNPHAFQFFLLSFGTRSKVDSGLFWGETLHISAIQRSVHATALSGDKNQHWCTPQAILPHY